MSTSGQLTPLPATAGDGDVPAWTTRLADIDGRGLTEAEMLDELRHIEELKGAAAAAQARLTAAYATSRRESARPSLKADPARLAKTLGGEIALARREAPARGSRLVGLAQALVHELPHTMAALTRGAISEWRATIVTKETACLSREDRLTVDRELADDLEHLGDRRLGDKARSIAYRLDPDAALRRTKKAEKDRRVSLRPAPDTMSSLHALLPVVQGVMVYACLRRHAESLKAAGDPRTLGQLMADTLVARVTKQDDSAAPAGPDIEIGLVMPARSLLGGSHEPAHLTGYGPIPATLARRLVRDTDKAWIRRLYAEPDTGQLVAADSKRRTFTGQLRALVVGRDQYCRTPYCNALIRHVDHVTEAAHGGRTTAVNGQGLCERCNYAKREWRVHVIRGPGHVIDIETWTGHHHRSTAPPLPGATRPRTGHEMVRRLLDEAG